MRNYFRIAPHFAAAVALFATSLPTSAGPLEIQGLVGIGADFGGDSLLTVVYQDGSTSTLQAGKGLRLTAGGVFSPRLGEDSAIDLQATANFKFGTITQASNQSASWIQWPIELAALYRSVPYHFRAGGGLSYHISPSLSASGAVLNGGGSFGNALGAFLLADYLFGGSERFSAGARYDIVNYSGPNISTAGVSGNSFGIFLNYFFGGDHPVTPAAVSESDASKNLSAPKGLGSPQDKDPPGLR